MKSQIYILTESAYAELIEDWVVEYFYTVKKKKKKHNSLLFGKEKA